MAETIIVAAAPEAEPETDQASLELAQTVGEISANLEHQETEIQEIEQTAETAEAIAESAQQTAWATMDQLHELRADLGNLSELVQQMVIQGSESEADQESEAVEILELPAIEEVPADLPAHNSGGILGFLGRVIH